MPKDALQCAEGHLFGVTLIYKEKWLDKKISSLGAKKKDISLLGLDDCGNIISVISHNRKNSKIIKTPQNKQKKNP
jgi:hypothetical protein